MTKLTFCGKTERSFSKLSAPHSNQAARRETKDLGSAQMIEDDLRIEGILKSLQMGTAEL
jgi:hypothetical protein